MNFNNLAFPLLFLVVSCSPADDQQNPVKPEQYDWDQLIDADLSRWDNYLSFQYTSDYDGSPPKNEQCELIEPIGLNNPEYGVPVANGQKWALRI